MAELPTVSVLMAVHNGERFLGEAIESILQQTFADFEFLIIDDGSTDTSPEILTRYAELDPRIRLVRREQSGLTKSLNEGLALARGAFIARHDADDVALPHRLATMLSFLDANASISAAGSWCETMDETGRSVGRYAYPTDHDLIQWAMLGYNVIVHPSAVVRRDCINRYGPYDDDYVYAQDYEIWTRWIGLGARLANVPEVLLKYRVSGEQITKNFSAQQTANVNRSAAAYIDSILPGSVDPAEVPGLRQLINPYGIGAEAAMAIPLLLRLFALPRFAKARRSMPIREHLARNCVIAVHRGRSSRRRAILLLFLTIRLWGGVLLERSWWACLAKQVSSKRSAARNDRRGDFATRGPR